MTTIAMPPRKPRHPHHPGSRRRQRGAGALAVSALLLLAAGITALYLNRSVILGQRTSASQLRAASAHELAEAGLEWAIGMLNQVHPVDASCASDATAGTSFRARYLVLPDSGAPDHLPVTTTSAPAYPAALPGCSVDAGSAALSCSCPASGPAALALGDGAPHFTVRFEPERDQPDPTDPGKFPWEAVRITAVGCTAASSLCTPPGPGAQAATDGADAAAIASVAVKLRPALIGGVFAALTCGDSCDPGSAYRIVNTSVAANGLLVHSGGAIASDSGTSYQTIPGLPVTSALIGHDPSLSNAACIGLFQARFGASIEQYARAPTTATIECASAPDCSASVQQAYAAGARAFHFPADVELADAELGSAAEPVLLVSPRRLGIQGHVTLHGVVFANHVEVPGPGIGRADIHGAIIACNEYENRGGGTLSYNDQVMARLRRSASQMVKVPGSWRDWWQP